MICYRSAPRPRRANKERGSRTEREGQNKGWAQRESCRGWLLPGPPGTDSKVMILGSATPSPLGIKTLSTSKTANLLVKTGFYW